MTAALASAANQVFPGPSEPAGHRIFEILLKPESVDEGEPITWALWRGMGTSEDENGVAPAEKGTFGLFVEFKVVPFP